MFDVWRFYFEMEGVRNYHLSSSQNSDLDNNQMDETEQKAQGKNTKRGSKKK